MFKFGERRHIEHFAQGLLYINPLRYFIRQEADSVSGDPNKGTGHMAQARSWRLQVKVAFFALVADSFTPVDPVRKTNNSCRVHADLGCVTPSP
jgi:hypothetical protein